MQPVEFLCDQINDDVVPVFSAKPMIAIGCEHLDLVIDNAHDGDVEGAAAEVEDENGVVLVQFVEPVSQRRCGWLVDDLEDIQTGELAGRNRGGALCVVEVSGHGDDRVCNRLIKIFLSVGLQFFDDQGRKFFGRINLTVEFAMKLVLRLAHFALHEIDNLLRLGDGIVLGHRAHNYVASVKENHRWRDALGFGVRDDVRFSVGIDVRDSRKGRAQIDSGYFACAHAQNRWTKTSYGAG